jgi:hypothetical protein
MQQQGSGEAVLPDSLYHPGFTKPVTDGQNSGIKISDCESLKSQTSRVRISGLL